MEQVRRILYSTTEYGTITSLKKVGGKPTDERCISVGLMKKLSERDVVQAALKVIPPSFIIPLADGLVSLPSDVIEHDYLQNFAFGDAVKTADGIF